MSQTTMIIREKYMMSEKEVLRSCEEAEAFKRLILDESKQTPQFEDEIFGNVSNYVAYPDAEEEEPLPGRLIFNAGFQSGNLGRVDCISPYEYDLFVRPDTCNPRYRMWFNFTVQGVTAGQKVIFNIVNFSKTKSLYRDGMSPMVKSTSRPKWQRVLAKNVFYYRCPDHAKNYVMTFAFAFDDSSDVYQFAYCYPYTYNRLQSYLADIEKLNLEYFTREKLCSTVQQRNIDLLTITSPKNLQGEGKRKIVFFTARVHPGETPSSYVCQGVIDFLISNHSIAQVLRENLVFMIVPMLNPDGVALGNYRCSLMGFDLNRFWIEPSVWAHPSIVGTKQLLKDLNKNPSVTLEFYIDLHSHSTSMNAFMYGNVYDNDSRFEQHSVFPKLLDANAEDFSGNNTSFNQDSLKAGTSRRTLGSCLSDDTNCYTLEVSFFGYMHNSTFFPYTEDTYFRLGRNVVKTFLNYYKLNQVVVHRFNNYVEGKNTNKNKKTAKLDTPLLHKRTIDVRIPPVQQQQRRPSVMSKRPSEQSSRVASGVQLKMKHRNKSM